MQPEAPLLYSQEPATSPYPEPDASNPNLHTQLGAILILSPHLNDFCKILTMVC
jgi:hypothetical protein